MTQNERRPLPCSAPERPEWDQTEKSAASLRYHDTSRQPLTAQHASYIAMQ